MFNLLDGEIVRRRPYPGGTGSAVFGIAGFRPVILFGRLGDYPPFFEKAEETEDIGGQAFSRYADQRDQAQRKGGQAQKDNPRCQGQRQPQHRQAGRQKERPRLQRVPQLQSPAKQGSSLYKVRGDSVGVQFFVVVIRHTCFLLSRG